MFWAKFRCSPTSGCPVHSSVVERSEAWETDPMRGRAWEEEEDVDNARFFGPFYTWEEARDEEIRVWDEEIWCDHSKGGLPRWRRLF